MAPPELGDVLLQQARAAIAREFGLPAEGAGHPGLAEPGACFVTLTLDGALRGCIGSLVAHRALGEDVRANACAAAFSDPRFPPLSAAEFARVRVEVSLLSAAEPFPVADEADACARLVPHEDGVILQWGSQRSTFLPQVWAQLPEPAQFLAQLKRKAGLPADFWAPELRLSRYRVQKWREGT